MTLTCLLIEEKALSHVLLRNIQTAYNGVFHFAYIQVPALHLASDVNSGLFWNALSIILIVNMIDETDSKIYH